MSQWIWFGLGQGINVLRQAKLVAGADPAKNPIGSVWGWIHRNAIGLAVRELFAIGGWMLLTHPTAGPAVIGVWFPAYAKFASVFVDLPFLAAPFGMVFSIASDFGLEKWTWLKAHIPPLGE